MIVSVGLCAVDIRTGDMKAALVRHIHPKSAEHFGGKMDGDTVMWWMGQDSHARNKLIDNIKTSGMSQGGVIGEINTFINGLAREAGGVENVRMWGMGPSFDCAKLTAMYTRSGVDVPWKYWAENCVRTVRRIADNHERAPKWDAQPRAGTHHDALDDAAHQANYVSLVNRWFHQETDIWLF